MFVDILTPFIVPTLVLASMRVYIAYTQPPLVFSLYVSYRNAKIRAECVLSYTVPVGLGELSAPPSVCSPLAANGVFQIPSSFVPGCTGGAAGSPTELMSCELVPRSPARLWKQTDIKGQICKGARHLRVLLGTSQELREMAYGS